MEYSRSILFRQFFQNLDHRALYFRDLNQPCKGKWIRIRIFVFCKLKFSKPSSSVGIVGLIHLQSSSLSLLSKFRKKTNNVISSNRSEDRNLRTTPPPSTRTKKCVCPHLRCFEMSHHHPRNFVTHPLSPPLELLLTTHYTTYMNPSDSKRSSSNSSYCSARSSATLGQAVQSNPRQLPAVHSARNSSYPTSTVWVAAGPTFVPTATKRVKSCSSLLRTT